MPLDKAVRDKIDYRNAQRLLKLPGNRPRPLGYTLRVNGVTSEAPPVTGLALEVKVRGTQIRVPSIDDPERWSAAGSTGPHRDCRIEAEWCHRGCNSGDGS